MDGKVVSVNISEKKGTTKRPVSEVIALENFGIKGDAHASSQWHRQISLLAIESIKKVRDKGYKINFGDFAENITTEGIDLLNLPIGSKLQIGEVLVEITQHGKSCHKGCEISKIVGKCIMPLEGVFAKVIKGGKIKKGDIIEIL